MSQYQPICLLKENPHYFNFRGKPTILITSGEHYASVFNRDFDYIRYLDTLQEHGFNHTRTSTGIKRELPGTFNIDGNSQAPTHQAYLAPWVRTDIPGCADGGNKFDLDVWNEEYFSRWKDFMSAAGERGIEVELMLFSEFHIHAGFGSDLWDICPINPGNNINNLHEVLADHALSMENVDGTKYLDAFITRLTKELNEFDNFHFEICNEPYYDEIPKEWMQHWVDLISNVERKLPNQHIFSQNIQANLYEFEKDEPLRGVGIVNFHYTGSDNILRNYWFPGVLGLNETGIMTNRQYQRQAWDVILGGAGLYNNLDYSFTVGHEDGSYVLKESNPGAGSPKLRGQLQILGEFINSFEFWKMKPATHLIKSVLEANSSYIMLAEEGRQYAAYFVTNQSSSQIIQCRVGIEMPAGRYEVTWMNPDTGKIVSRYDMDHSGGRARVDTGLVGERVEHNCEVELALKIVACQ